MISLNPDGIGATNVGGSIMRISLDWLGVSTFRPVIDDLTVPAPPQDPVE
jgi:hypothetical protein